MARGGPRKADGPSKKGSKATVTLLTTNDNPEIPPMPPAENYIGVSHIRTTNRGYNDTRTLEAAGVETDPGAFDEEEMVPDWNPAVVEWWESIWTSPMASEFVDADIHGLYMGCVFLHESLNPFYKLGDRTSAFGKFEGVQKAYGLTPSARESLRWTISQGAAAQKRTDQIRASASAGRTTESKDNVMDMYKRHA